MSAVSCVITFFAQKAGGAVIQLQHLPLWERICNAAMSYCRYALKMFWPDPLMVYYHHEKNNVMISAAVLSAIVLCLITAGCWYVRKNRPYCLIGWLWYLGTLVPVIGIVQVGVQAMAERYTYIPSIGLFVAIVWFIGDATAKTPKIRAGTQLLAGAVIIACAVKTDAQVKVWKDTVTLFSHVLAIDPRGEFPNLSMGAAYLRQGRLAEAQEYFKRALEYNPFEPQTLSYSAFCLMQTHEQHNLEVARQRLERALSVSPNNRHALINMAEWCLLTGRPKDAETYCKKVIPMDPDSLTARLYLADALQAQEKLDEAIQAYRQALVIDPNNYDTHNNLGILFGRQGSMEEALKEFRLSLAIKPDQTMAHSNIGRILMERHQLTEAVNEFTQALKFDPSNAIAHNNLGMAWFQLGDYEKAVEHFSEAVRFDSTYADAKRNLDIAQLRMKTGNVENGKK